MVQFVSREAWSSSRATALPIRARFFLRPLVGAALLIATQSDASAANGLLRALIVGGGPNLASNQAAIESNVRYVTKLLPPRYSSTTLFADGKRDSATVIYQPERSQRRREEELLEFVFPNVGRRRQGRPGNTSPNASARPAPPVGFGGITPVQGGAQAPAEPQSRPAAVPRSLGNFKVPELAHLDGASKAEGIQNGFGNLSNGNVVKGPIFLYFTGHGSKTEENPENNYYNLWDNGKFTVQDLSSQLRRLPQKDPVVLVMVQCFSGAFGNVIFQGGDPKAAPVERDIVGFFASTKDRVAAGCTPAVNEEYYYDFTSYFFSALTGRDRLDRKAAPDADFNRDGQVGMDEAFYWSVINDNSIDVPVATSDVFLERFAPLEGEIWQATPYKTLVGWASPAQRAALEGLSNALKLTGENRIQQAKNLDIDARTKQTREQLQGLGQRLRTLQEESRKTYGEAFPNLTSQEPAARAEARRLALIQIGTEVQAGKWQAHQDLIAELNTAQGLANELSVAQAKQLRFLRLAQKVVRDQTLRTGNNAAAKQRYAKLLAGEARTLLPHHD
jgi:hypothetical protein